MSSYGESKWFEHLFGFPESIKNVDDNFVVTEGVDGDILTSKCNGKSYNVGKFSLRNIPSFGELAPVGGGKLHLIHGKGRRGPTRLVDVLTAQSQPEFDGACFLAASNFNCLEFVSDRQTPRAGVTCYISDHTQGPFCVLATGPAIVYRNYFLKHDGYVGQLEKEINMLKDTAMGEMVWNGYPHINWVDMEELEKANWDDLNQFYVGVHENLELTTTRAARGFEDAPTGRIVHHIFAAALSYTYYVRENDLTVRIGAKLLEAQYRLAIMTAWELSKKYPGRQGSKKLVLTLLGGGCFGNSMDVICGAIASCQNLIQDSGLDVYVTCFDDYTFQDVEELLGGVVTATGGTIIPCDGKIE